MIKDLSLENFQSHKKSSLEFSEGVNVIIGSSDSGKSSIIRSLQWVLFNRPSGDSFRSWWGGITNVVVDGVSRIKGGSKGLENCYEIGLNRFQAMGQGVPEDVTTVLNLSMNLPKLWGHA